jgi:transposase-like protein
MAKYNKKMADRIVKLLRSDSYTISEVCDMVNIAESTYYKWQAEIKEFSENIKKANDYRMKFFVAEAKKSLLKKIQGYTVQEKHTVMIDSKELGPDGKRMPRIKEQKIIDKHFQPDTGAIIFTLTNGDPDTWKNRQNSELTGKDGKDLIPARVLSKKEAKELLDNLENEY